VGERERGRELRDTSSIICGDELPVAKLKQKRSGVLRASPAFT